MDEFNLEILTPVRKYLSMKAETIIVDTDDGQRSFYSKMYDLITPLIMLLVEELYLLIQKEIRLLS